MRPSEDTDVSVIKIAASHRRLVASSSGPEGSWSSLRSLCPRDREVNVTRGIMRGVTRWRRSFTIFTAAAAVGWCAAGLRAQASIDRLVIVAPAAPGGGWDQTARALQHVLEVRRLARIVEVQNVPGAAGTIGLAQFVNGERGNGRALLVSGLVMLGATLWNDSPVAIGQVTPIARLTGEYEVVAVPAASPHHDLASLIAAFRRHPEGIAWGGGSAGGTDHILAGLLAEAAGVDPRRVNYVAFSGGGEAVAALLGGHVTAGVSGYSEFAAHIASGRLRAIAISSPARAPGVDVPTIRERGLDIELVNWRAVLAPAGIATDDRERLTAVVRAAVRSEEWRKVLRDREWTDLYLDGPAFDAYLRSERDRVRRVVARLRGPAGGPVSADRRLAPLTVLALALVVVAGKVMRRRRTHLHAASAPGSRGRHETAVPINRRAISSTAAGLAAFLVLMLPLGFIVAATALFALTHRGFSRASDLPSAQAALPGLGRGTLIGAAFSVLIYVAFTRGLDLSLPAGLVWSWMR